MLFMNVEGFTPLTDCARLASQYDCGEGTEAKSLSMPIFCAASIGQFGL